MPLSPRTGVFAPALMFLLLMVGVAPAINANKPERPKRPARSPAKSPARVKQSTPVVVLIAPGALVVNL